MSGIRDQARDAVTRAILSSGITLPSVCNSAYKQISKFHAQFNISPPVSPRDTLGLNTGLTSAQWPQPP